MTGAEALPGSRGVVVLPAGLRGRCGSTASCGARCEEGADPGDEIVVERLDPELLLVVRKAT